MLKNGLLSLLLAGAVLLPLTGCVTALVASSETNNAGDIVGAVIVDAEIAHEVSKALKKEFVQPGKSEKNTATQPHCPEGQTLICSTTTGCYCNR